MKNPKAKKISLTAEMREYLASIIMSHRATLEDKVRKGRTNKDVLQHISNDTQLLNKLEDK